MPATRSDSNECLVGGGWGGKMEGKEEGEGWKEEFISRLMFYAIRITFQGVG